MATRDELLKDIKAVIFRCTLRTDTAGLDHQAEAIVAMLDAKYFSVAEMDMNKRCTAVCDCHGFRCELHLGHLGNHYLKLQEGVIIKDHRFPSR